MNPWERNYKMAPKIREMYPPGTRLVLHYMEDPFAPVPPGTRGTVDCVDDQAQIHMQWDNGRRLAIIPGVDSFRKLTEEEIMDEQGPDIPGGWTCPCNENVRYKWKKESKFKFLDRWRRSSSAVLHIRNGM